MNCNPRLYVGYQEVISIYKKIEKLHTKLYHPFSVSLMQTREKILKVSSSL